MPSFFSSDDYRVLLAMWLRADRRQNGPGSSERLAGRVGVSAAHIINIAAQRRDMQLSQLGPFIQGMDLQGDQALWYSAIVRANHAPTEAEREVATVEVKAIGARHGFPERPPKKRPGRPKGRPRDDEQPMLRYGWLLHRAWLSARLPLDPAVQAEALDHALTEAQLARTLEAYPELRNPRWTRRVVSLDCMDPWSQGGVAMALSAMAPRIDRYQQPLRSVTTAVALLRASDVAALADGIAEEWSQALLDAEALVVRAGDTDRPGARRLFHLSVTLHPMHSPFMSTSEPEMTGTSEQILADRRVVPRSPKGVSSQKPMHEPLPSPYAYVALHAYLQAWMAAMQIRKSSFRWSGFARLAGVSVTHVRNVLTGRRKLMGETVDRFARAMGLDRHAAHYFALLATLSHTRSTHYRALLLREMAALAAMHASKVHPDLRHAVLMDPRNQMVLEAAAAPGFRAAPEWVAARLGLELNDASAAMAELLAAGLLVKDGRGGVKHMQVSCAAPSQFEEATNLRFQQRIIAGAIEAAHQPAAIGFVAALPALADDLELVELLAPEVYSRIVKRMKALSSSALESAGSVVVVAMQVSALPLTVPVPVPT